MPAASTSEAPSRVGAIARGAVRVLLGASLLLAGIGHLSFARAEFQAQVPPWLPLDPDLVVVASGVVEIALGLGLLLLRRHRALVGLAAAAFFIVMSLAVRVTLPMACDLVSPFFWGMFII